MKTLLLVLMLCQPLKSFCAEDTLRVKHPGSYAEVAINAGAAKPVIRQRYAVVNDMKPGAAFRIAANFVFNNKQRHFYGFAAIDAGVVSYSGNATYFRHQVLNGRDSFFYSDVDEGALRSILGINGGIGYNTHLAPKLELYTTLSAGPMVNMDIRNKVKNQYGLHCAFATGVRVTDRIALGAEVFYTNAWFRSGSAPFSYSRNIYSLVSASIQLKLRLSSIRL